MVNKCKHSVAIHFDCMNATAVKWLRRFRRLLLFNSTDNTFYDSKIVVLSQGALSVLFMYIFSMLFPMKQDFLGWGVLWKKITCHQGLWLLVILYIYI